MIRHLIPRIEVGPWGGAAVTNDGSPTGDEARGRAVCFQWFGIMVEFGFGLVMPRPAKPTCETLPDDVTVEQAARHLGVELTSYGKIGVAHRLVRAGYRPLRHTAFGSMPTRYVRKAA